MPKKNILMILCDQLSATALTAYGNNYVRAPHIQSIAQEGAVMENAYTACPLCQPARAAFWTSRYAHQTHVLSNLPNQGFPTLSDSIPTLGETFQNAGWHCVHFGKTHDYGSLRGFDVVASEQIPTKRTDPAINFDYETFLDVDTTQKTTAFLETPPEESFLAVADFQNPHNICSYIGENSAEHMKFQLERELPPLPKNFAFDDIANRPEFVQYLCCAHRRQRHASHWSEDDFRHYLYAYYTYISMVDRQIGQVLDALEKSGRKQDTLVVFFSDHGEGMAAHGLVTKYGAFYEETNHVPLFYQGGGIAANRRVGGVTSLLDVMPTLLEYAGIPAPGGMEGISHWPQLMGERNKTDNEFVCGEWYDEFRDYTVPGRMICDERYKYTVYQEENSEELYDMEKDRLEQTNLARRPEYTKLLEEYRQKLVRHMEQTSDPFPTLSSHWDKSLHRRHPLGMGNHEGLSAVELYANSLKKGTAGGK